MTKVIINKADKVKQNRAIVSCNVRTFVPVSKCNKTCEGLLRERSRYVDDTRSSQLRVRVIGEMGYWKTNLILISMCGGEGGGGD